MFLGAELFTRCPLTLQAQDSFEVFLSIEGKPVSETFGKDDFLLPISMGANRRITATGRKCLHRNQRKTMGLGSFETGPTELVLLPPLPQGKRLLLFIKNSVVQEEMDFCRSFSLCLLTERTKKEITLTQENLVVDWSNHGKFLIDLTGELN